MVRRVNPAFVDRFDVTDDVRDAPLAGALASIQVGGSDQRVLEPVRHGDDTVVTCQCDTTAGQTPFRARVYTTGGGGYVVFEEAGQDDRLDVLEYLTHSLRNPLEVATVHTEVMADAETLEYIDTVQTAHERMEAIIADAVDLAQHGSVVAESDTVPVADVAKAAWETVGTADSTLQVDAPGTVDADERRLRVLFEDLFRNAVRHGSDEDHDVCVTVGGMAGGFYVADNGRGIPAGDREQVLDAGYTTDDDGTGLGLAIVAAIAEAHGWDLSVTASDDDGSRFEFTGV